MLFYYDSSFVLCYNEPMIKNIVFDIGNVVLGFKPIEYFSMYENGEYVCRQIFQCPLWKEYDRGTVKLAEIEAQVTTEMPQFIDLVHEILDKWMDVLVPLETLSYIDVLKSLGYRIFLLSNLSYDAAVYIEENVDLFQKVDGYVLSCNEKVIKPEVEIYETLFRRFNIKAEESIFLDDLEANIEGAKALGMDGIVVNSPSQALQDLERKLGKEFYVK
ncbi:epoxide hydrolase-like predicted phosphatase [Breznakia sp. PH1-1]|nr:epoxide hydrolase-like predicted phosphatase [Breznakia sp. PH1-1]MDH6405014.1 epoxide hydrolase-like predicted phosphatase [Breznakia sp. PF1-11]MDH6412726.1 epoxide hydrolase-like predicted phosphatase [Breznakia sp. PFB1-11]MDH6415089.1 epoxide hydrolase-like predicted phosphatase [Breznakia sp. PFB1-14]MDH6417397.1 epoxide hydrolase-like predicted phosphatase [Breznakia sp. PFB1-4]MDH6419759.1 epoxide hydrolase-like predicted phosphatase [Breznakia sp. PFB1-12]MDH6474791.1 epoxide hydr